MIIKIHRILKSDLSKENTIDALNAGMSNSSGMTISHFAYSLRQTEATIPYTIDIVNENVPKVNNVDFCVVIRTKVDLTAPNPNEKILEDIGRDVGEYCYVNKVPSSPNDLPPGFQEFYKG